MQALPPPLYDLKNDLTLRYLGIQDYQKTWQAMRDFTHQRNNLSPDELWICQHPAVFTQGQAGLADYVGDIGDIPLVATDRGGQVTYHGLGQWIFYPLIDLNRRKLGIRAFVNLLEEVTINLLQHHHIPAERLEGAPGIYVRGNKIASLGLKVHKGRSYHGLALNLAMDLTPFHRIVPCGLQGMKVTQWQDQVTTLLTEEESKVIAQQWVDYFQQAIIQINLPS
jgi:lipoyl(octanoyl) transferase